MLRTYKTCNPIVRFPKYELNNKLLGGVTLLRVTLGVTWTELYIYIYRERERERERERCDDAGIVSKEIRPDGNRPRVNLIQRQFKKDGPPMPKLE